MRRVVKIKRLVHEVSPSKQRIYRGTLSEEYDGIGQYVMVALAGSSMSSAYRARLASGDFGTGQTIPRGSPVSVFSNRGQLEVLSLGAK